jgi:hypothetical protein
MRVVAEPGYPEQLPAYIANVAEWAAIPDVHQPLWDFITP